MRTLFATAIRTLAFVRKEIAEVLRQPRLLVTLVAAPFLILLIFGAGLRDVDPPVRTVFVSPEDQELAGEVVEFAQTQRERLIVEGVTDDEAQALARLRAGDVGLVVVFPAEVAETVREDEQAVITLYHNQMDPIESQAIFLYMQEAVSQINQQVLGTVIAESQTDSEELEERVATARERTQRARTAVDRDDPSAMLEISRLRADTAALVLAAGPAAAALDGVVASEDDESLHGAVGSFNERVEGIEDPDDFEREADDLDRDLAAMESALTEFRSLSPEVLVAPFRGELVRVVGGDVSLSDFYAPAVVVVLLQHLLVTFVALSIVREAELGTSELYRVAPLRTGELVTGKYVAHMIIAAVVAVALVLALVLGLGVPMQGNWLMLVFVLLAVLFASSGLGFCIAGVSRSDSQAVQYTMLVLLATIFFSGFTLSLDRFVRPFDWIGYLLPATYGVRLMRDVMLRGILGQPLLLGVLLVFGAVLALLGWLAVRRRLTH